jgi:hypothetical protein
MLFQAPAGALVAVGPGKIVTFLTTKALLPADHLYQLIACRGTGTLGELRAAGWPRHPFQAREHGRLSVRS